jgi:hypothetical protein
VRQVDLTSEAEDETKATTVRHGDMWRGRGGGGVEQEEMWRGEK